ncbi:putative P-loop containing nucleoside triphosphate hydrolase protein [Seiridium unicorne]|uniref:P-loop containing nucleoside triphosphate hydrolase protein n=1 Tax=Seiridium unicorne TaxID=138068 RepID=A0ABR2UUJ9_9PEZI
MARPEEQLSSNVGSRGEFKTYHHTRKKDGKLITQPTLEPFGNGRDSADSDRSYALVINRNFTAENSGEATSTTLQVNSPHILKAFRDVVKTYPTVPSDFTSPFELRSPFQLLTHYWDELEAYRSETDSRLMRRDLNLLFDFMNHEVGPGRELVVSMLKKEHINYLTAWVVFRPGELLYMEEMGHAWLMRCEKTAYEESRRIGPYMEVHCTYTDYDGTFMGKARHVIKIIQKRSFGQENPAFIADLPVYPRKYVKEGGTLEERLMQRGLKFLGFEGTTIQAYNGLAKHLNEPPDTYWDPDMADFEGVWLPYTEVGRVVLDRKTFQEDHFSDQVGVARAEPEPLLCPPFTIGYSLGKKQWSRFFVDNLSNMSWKENAWESLILDDEQKNMVQALVSSHQYPEDARNQAEQKGKGLVILLHGSPGSGKTLTAETAAEGTKRVLFSASLGDLNKTNIPWRFEYELKRILQYATLWKAVVLLDEADVFLEQRNEQSGDHSRNSLVAVFLKELEYFSGIVFLTTNRMSSFDRAMKSRIHLALGYGPPGDAVRQRIWAQCLNRVPIEKRDLGDLDEVAQRLSTTKMNGREISNALNTAQTIARFRNMKLQMEHIESVIKVKSAFDETIRRDMRKLTSDTVWKSGIVRQNSILSEEPEEY